MSDGERIPADMREQPQPVPTRFRYLLYVIGAGMIFIGLKGIFHNDRHYENPQYWVKLFVGGALVHDLIVAPIVLTVSVVLSRLIRAPYRGPVQFGLFASAVFGLVAYPGVRQLSYAKDNTSADPLNYAHGLLICLVVIWGVVLVVDVFRFVSRRRAHL
jgi:hypothetical protein